MQKHPNCLSKRSQVVNLFNRASTSLSHFVLASPFCYLFAVGNYRNMRSRNVCSFLILLSACLILITTAQRASARLKVFRGTLVHSRVRTEMEVLEDYLIGFDENNQGRVRIKIVPR